jgi:rare lipoprotein A
VSRRVNAFAALLAMGGCAMIAAASASASGGGGTGGGGTGGVGLGGVSLTRTTTASLGLAASMRFIGGKIGVVTPGNVTVNATQNGITIDASASTMLGGRLVIKGVAPASAAGATVQIQRLGHETTWAWAATTQASVGPNGSFTAVWTTNHIGRFELRALLGQATSGPVVMITVFRPSYATWYNLFGNHTACGELLTRRTLGVANRTLACGERVAIYCNGKTIVVPVIDRGPYANGADWDLTEATARALGMGGLAQIGAVSLPRKQ